MNPAFRRFLALVAVFVIAFLAVSLLRTWRNGGDLRNLVPGLKKESGNFRPEKFTLPERPPLDLGQVELLTRLNEEYSRVTDAVVPSVVSIDTTGVRTERLQDVWGRIRVRRYPTQGQGSGVIVTKEGHIVTNHHVIAGQQEIQVTLHGGKIYKATLIGEDSLLDIAVLKIDSTETFTPLKFGDSAQVQVGQMVFAVGNPFGLGETVTQGIISAKERSISENQRDLFQTDAAINPGNSGGPLVNLRGEIIGINVAIISADSSNPNSGFQGVGFSIPAGDVKDALFQILERGRPIRGVLGVQMAGMAPVVSSITPGSPAQLAGLLSNDLIVSFDGEPIRTTPQLMSLVQRAKVGEKVRLGIKRGSESLELTATIAESKPEKTKPLPAPETANGRLRDSTEILQSIGVETRDLSSAERLRGFNGAVVVTVLPNALAAGKLQLGDLVLSVNNMPINTAREFYQYLAASAAVQDTSLQIIREGRPITISLPAVPRMD